MKTLTGLEASKYILDPIAGMVPITKPELDVISTPMFQRLRNVTQLSIASLVYPGATHNRFQHSLGTLCVMDKLLYALKLDKRIANDEAENNEIIQIMRMAALLHDCGHLPFSHTFENFYDGQNHEMFGRNIIEKSSIGSKLRQNDLDPEIISRLIGGDISVKDSTSAILIQLQPLLHSDADADRMDYLLRDAYFTGVPFGKIDLDRICNFISLVDGKICFHEKAQGALEDFLFSRYQMYKTVYAHKTVIGYDLVLLKLYPFIEKYAVSIDSPFTLPQLKDFGEKDEEWYDNDFCGQTEAKFFDNIHTLVSGKVQVESEEKDQIKNLYDCIRFRKPVRNCFRFDDLSPISTREYCEREGKLFEKLQADHQNIVKNWSFLRHDPRKPLKIATPIAKDFDDDQDFTHIHILKKGRKPELLQSQTNSVIGQWSTHHRVLIAYYHKDASAQNVIQELAEQYISHLDRNNPTSSEAVEGTRDAVPKRNTTIM